MYRHRVVQNEQAPSASSPVDSSPLEPSPSHRIIPDRGGGGGGSDAGLRQISYTIIEADHPEDRTTAIIVFAPLSGCSQIIGRMHLNGYRCSVLSVDRPSCAETSAVAKEEEDTTHSGRSWLCGIGSRRNNTDSKMKKQDGDANANDSNNCTTSNPSPSQPSNTKDGPITTTTTNTTTNEHDKNIRRDRDYEFLRRIRVHAHDVLQVLHQENITKVYLLGVCIGHPYAVEVCRQIMMMGMSDHHPQGSILEIGGLTLVAPFVSTVCPQSWSVARMGTRVPSYVLYGCTEAMSATANWMIPKLMSPTSIRKLVSPEERETGGWTDGDFEECYQALVELTPLTKRTVGIEARLGVSKIWQFEVLDRFAVESGFGLVVSDDSGGGRDDPKEGTPSQRRGCMIPVRIHACREDKLATLPSVEWIAKRCYGNCPIDIEETIHSHEVMTFLGGPPRDPKLLHKIARDWMLL